ncbi:hypothetical protein A2U01_0086387, partial [Trifolium medium]|nr:hypothetical protein [Trifolium medium]
LVSQIHHGFHESFRSNRSRNVATLGESGSLDGGATLIQCNVDPDRECEGTQKL